MVSYLQSFGFFCMLCALSQSARAQTVVTMGNGDLDVSTWQNENRTVNFTPTTLRTSIHATPNDALNEGPTAILQLHSGMYLNDGLTDQTGLQFGHQAQMGWAGNWGALALARQSNSYYTDHIALDTSNGGTTVNTSDVLAGVTTPNRHQAIFAAYSDLDDRADGVNNLTVKKYSLSYAYPLSQMTHLFVAKTRIDNPGALPISSFTGTGTKQIMLGLRHSF